MNRMKRMKRMTINLLGAGLLLGATAVRAEEKAPAAFDEKAAATAAYIERQSALPWSELREEFKTPYGIGLFKPAPTGVTMVASSIFDCLNCTTPAVVDGKIVVRTRNALDCYDLTANV